jgi:hypothetical protein
VNVFAVRFHVLVTAGAADDFIRVPGLQWLIRVCRKKWNTTPAPSSGNPFRPQAQDASEVSSAAHKNKTTVAGHCLACPL